MDFRLYGLSTSCEKRDGFTLIELLLSITLSAILMTGIVVFVSSSLGSNMAIKKTLEESNGNERFNQRLTEVFGNITGSGIYATGSSFWEWYLTGAFIATWGSNLPIAFFGLSTAKGYCDDYGETASETGTVMKLAIRQFVTPAVQNNTSYILSFTGNSVFSGTNRIVGTGYPGNDLDESSWTLTELSSPSSITSSGNHLYIADTMNDRVLSYDTASGTITELLGRENGIRKPTSLFFSGSSLLVTSSGNGKIFSLQDGNGDGSVFSDTFKVARNFSANTIRFTFSGISNITSPTASGSFTFSGFSKNTGDFVGTGANLLYTFSGWNAWFFTGTTYGIEIDNINSLLNTPGNYTVRVDFQNGGATQYSDTFPYFLKWDNSLESGTGNLLRIVAEGISYPHNITGADSWSGSIDWMNVLSQNPPGNEILSSLPVRDLEFQVTGDILTIRYHEYTHYDCLLGKHRTEEKIKKVLLR